MIDTAGKTGGHTHGKKAGGATGTLKGEPAAKVADILHKVAHRGTSLCKERGC